ncbi:MAG: polyphosphate kinase 1 [Chloroflexi bacterium]|nr:polyphosphate kinase 1 [Chloroflexota bacterium]
MPRQRLTRRASGANNSSADASPAPKKTHEVAAVPPDAVLFLNRELSQLEFFRRVLDEAQDETNPLLERVKFLSIVGSIMAEFFMIRVAGLRQQLAAGVVDRSTDGLTAAEQLKAIRKVVLDLMGDARNTLRALLPQLARAGIHIHDYATLDVEQRAALRAYFDQMVFPVLTPLAFDPARPFPHISNMSMNLAVIVRTQAGHERFARIKVPNTLPRLLPVKPPDDRAPANGRGPHDLHFVWLEQVIAANLAALFPGQTIVETHPFRITRDADIALQEMDAEDLLDTVEQSLRERRFGSVVRMTIDRDMPESIRDVLAENLDLSPDTIYTLDPPLGTSDLISLYALDRPDLKDPPFAPVRPPGLDDEEGDIFAAIRRQDILLHHPYDSFAPVVDFLEQAARDPHVLAIKQTLYRVGRNSPVVQALMEAARNGKQVAVVMELKARFDEESNIEWARALEQEGVHVVYGLVGLKTHSKIALVVRKEGDQLRRYVHLATGNYNPGTARLYTDIGLLTANPDMGADATDVFNYLTGYSTKTDYRKFLVAPINLRSGIDSLIRREIEHQKQGRGGHLILKLNSLVDKQIIHLLYEASQAGVKVDLIARGICCLRPGIPGVSDNIRVTSIVGRFLEHSRLFWFRNGGAEQVYAGSADLMPRNLDRRVEIVFPFEDPRVVRQVRDQILATYLADNVKARVMLPDGTYQRRRPEPGEATLSAQQVLLPRAERSV